MHDCLLRSCLLKKTKKQQQLLKFFYLNLKNHRQPQNKCHCLFRAVLFTNERTPNNGTFYQFKIFSRIYNMQSYNMHSILSLTFSLHLINTQSIIMGKRTSIELRELIIKHFKNGKSQRQIAELVEKSRSTVQCIIQRFVLENRVHNKGRNAPNKVFSERDENWLIRQIKKDPHQSARTIASEAAEHLGKSCHPETIRKIFRKHDLHARTSRNKPFVNARNRQLRVKFAKEYLLKPDIFWNNVIFADESKYNLFGSDCKALVWRKPNTELNPANLHSTVKHGGGHVMVWGCMSAAGVGNLTFIDGNMDKMMYLNILKNNLLQSAAKVGIAQNFHYYQDNDPKHKSDIVQRWLIYNCPHLLQTPAQSPDINPIENLWHILEINIRKHKISNEEDLKKALQEEWNAITPEYTSKLVSSMSKRLNDVINQRGYPTKY